MGETFATSIQVVGHLRDAAACRNLVAAISADRGGTSWRASTDGSIPSDAGRLLAAYIDAGSARAELLSDRFHGPRGFVNVEAACASIGLGFVRTTWPDGGHRGSVTVLHPGDSMPREWELGTVPAPSVSGLLALAEGSGPAERRLEAVRRELHLCLDHRYGLPEALTADPEARSACAAAPDTPPG